MSNSANAPQRGAPLFRLAAKNFRSYAWINLRMAFVFACLSFLVCLFTCYNSALSGKREDLLRNTASARYVCLTSATEKSFPRDFAEEYFPGQEGISFGATAPTPISMNTCTST